MKIKPLGNFVCIDLLLKEKISADIYIPEDKKDKVKTQKAKVLAVGQGILNEDGKRENIPEVKEGDEIVITKLGVMKCEINDEHLHFIEGENIVAVIEN